MLWVGVQEHTSPHLCLCEIDLSSVGRGGPARLRTAPAYRYANNMPTLLVYSLACVVPDARARNACLDERHTLVQTFGSGMTVPWIHASSRIVPAHVIAKR